MNDESLEEIQTKISFLERANSDLSDVVFRQQRELAALAARLERVAQRLESAEAEEGRRAADEERPPHY